MSTTAGSAPPSTNLRDDAGLIGLVGLAHLVSHFSQLLLAPLFPWLKEAFNASYIELGFLMTLFFTVSCAVQTAAGFLVDRFGPRPILFSGLALLGLTSFGFGLSPNYWTMALFSVLAGVGNGVFHPANYTLLNRKVSAARLGHAYSVHGITGSLGWALAPAVVVPLAIASEMTTGTTGLFDDSSSRVKTRPRISPMFSVVKNSGPTTRRAGSSRKSPVMGTGVPSISRTVVEFRPHHGASDAKLVWTTPGTALTRDSMSW